MSSRLSKRRVLAISDDLDQLRRIVASLERAGAEVDAQPRGCRTGVDEDAPMRGDV